jgi:hypothetical protein
MQNNTIANMAKLKIPYNFVRLSYEPFMQGNVTLQGKLRLQISFIVRLGNLQSINILKFKTSPFSLPTPLKV